LTTSKCKAEHSQRAVAAESEQQVKLSGRDEQRHISQSWGLATE